MILEMLISNFGIGGTVLIFVALVIFAGVLFVNSKEK
jgi:hypothetical protein